jgi:hypothetical protein
MKLPYITTSGPYPRINSPTNSSDEAKKGCKKSGRLATNRLGCGHFHMSDCCYEIHLKSRVSPAVPERLRPTGLCSLEPV